MLSRPSTNIPCVLFASSLTGMVRQFGRPGQTLTNIPSRIPFSPLVPLVSQIAWLIPEYSPLFSCHSPLPYIPLVGTGRSDSKRRLTLIDTKEATEL